MKEKYDSLMKIQPERGFMATSFQISHCICLHIGVITITGVGILTVLLFRGTKGLSLQFSHLFLAFLATSGRKPLSDSYSSLSPNLLPGIISKK